MIRNLNKPPFNRPAFGSAFGNAFGNAFGPEGAGVPAPVAPNFAGLQCWLDLPDASTVTLTGPLIDQIDDKSGNGRNATASGVARLTYILNQANLGKNVARGDGVNTEMMVDLSFLVGTNFTIMGVAERRVITSNNYITGGGISSGNQGLFCGWRNATTFAFDFFGFAVDVTVPAFVANRPNIFTTLFSQTTGKAAKTIEQGVEFANTGPTFTAPLTALINGRFGRAATTLGMPFDGDIAEVVYYDRVLTAGEEELNKIYFSNKYGLPLSSLSSLLLLENGVDSYLLENSPDRIILE